ncbi:MAG: TonB-dependent receptor [bacterium]
MKTRALAVLRICLLGALSGLLVTSTPAAAETGTGRVTGRLVEASTGRAVAGALVEVLETDRATRTDDLGAFVLEAVPVGVHQIRATPVGLPPTTRSDVLVSEGRTTTLRIEAAAGSRLETVDVVASEFRTESDNVTTSVTLNYEEIRRSPGAIGDVSRLVQSLPGVVNANDQRNDIVARGGSPVENLTLVDGIEVPNLNHFAAQSTSGGPISMLNNELIEDATFLAGGYGARYGNRLSSVLDIALREGSRERFESEIDVSIAGAGLIAEGPIAEGQGAWVVSARQSYLALLAGPFGLEAIPYTTNYQGKVTYDVTPSQQIEVLSIGGRDNIEFEVDATDLEDPLTENIDARGWRMVNGAAWNHYVGERGTGRLVLSDSYATFDTDIHDDTLGGALTYRNRSVEGETTLGYDLEYDLRDSFHVRAGTSAKAFRTSLDLEQPYGQQNPFSTDTTRVNAVAIDRADHEWLGSSYLQLSRSFGSRVELTGGARVDRFGYRDATRLGPRAGATLRIGGGLDFVASAGRYYQQPPLVFVYADPLNAELDPIRADHYVAGFAYNPREDLRITLEAYLKRYADYPVSTEYPAFSLANSGDVYGVAGLLFPMTSAGEGRSHGVELYIRKKLARSLYGQVSYTWSRTEHKALDGVYRRGSFDSPHTATVIAGYKFGSRWELSSRVSGASGRPYTPPAPESVEQNRYILDLDRLNAERARNYFRLDLRGDYRFRVGPSNVTMFFEIQNVTDRENVFLYLWNRKTRSLDSQNQIGFLPVFGMNVEM